MKLVIVSPTPGELRQQRQDPVDHRKERDDRDHRRERQRGGGDRAAVVAELARELAQEPAAVTPCFEPDSEHHRTP